MRIYNKLPPNQKERRHSGKQGRPSRNRPPNGLRMLMSGTWQALQEWQITLSLGRLLQLVPRFTDGLKSAMTPPNSLQAPPFFSNPKEGPAVVDTSNLAITAIVKVRELQGTIVDGGLGVNVISLRTCDTLGIQEWEPCPFWLRMADTSP